MTHLVHEQRVIRVFVSSTFRDMQAERDELVKYTFPKLRKMCDERNVVWSEVDLRWGITEEQSERGEVLPICLAEIQRCRPFFIGLLGERYGWIPDEIPKELIEQEEWLKEHLYHSVTELEILHGVLNDPQMNNRALFYFRDSAYLDSLSIENKSEFLELPTKEEIQKHGREEAERHAEERKRRLISLKKRIKEHCEKNKMPEPREFPTPKELGEMILRDMTEIIERLYPKDETPEPLDRDALEHEAFAQSRAKVYISRQSYFDRLDAHIQSENQPLVLLGESGSGKSALLANWALQYRQTHTEDLLIMHFIGATPYSADWTAMLRRIMGELKRRFDIKQEIPDKPDELRSAFANWLYMAAAKGRCVLILDSLNQLEDRDGAPDLVWLLPVVPPNVRMILSTLPGRALDDLKKRGLPTLQIEPLSFDERKKLIKDYLAQFSKELNVSRTALLAKAEQTSNPLFLRALLDELRVFGIHEKLNERITHYLEAKTVDKLYEKILDRYEQDYERERPALVKDALSLIWASRRGLSEAELLDLLGEKDEPLPRAYWSPLHLAAESSLVIRSGLIGFAHNYLCQAVRDKYLPNDGQQKNSHLKLAEYFTAQQLTHRQVDELPWQLAEMLEWKKLAVLLSDLSFLRKAWEVNVYELVAYWSRIENEGGLKIVDVYRFVLDAPENFSDSLWFITLLLENAGYTKESLLLRESMVEIAVQSGNREYLAESFNNLALSLMDKGELERAMSYFHRAEEIAREQNAKELLQTVLGNKATVFQMRGDLVKAVSLIEEKQQICEKLGDKLALANCFERKANFLPYQGQTDKPLTLLKEAYNLRREFGDKAGLANCLGNQATILRMQGKLDEAMQLLEEEEQICRELNLKKMLAVTLGGKAGILYDQGQIGMSLDLYDRAEIILRDLDDKPALILSYRNHSIAAMAQGNMIKAMMLNDVAEEIAAEIGMKSAASTSPFEFIKQMVGELEPEEKPKSRTSFVPHPHPNTDAATASRLNLEYQKALAEWKALSWWQRLWTKKPEPPKGI